jgi:hypothetical protein
MPANKSAPTYMSFSFDVPEPQAFSGEFEYNYFLKDEKKSSNPWSDLNIVKRHTPRSDYKPESSTPGVPARKNILKFSALNTISDLSDNKFTESQRLSFLENNGESILSEVEAQSERAAYVSIQDDAAAKEIQNSLDAVLKHQKATERGLSPLEAVLKFNSITSDKINAKDILDVTEIEANSNLTYYDPVSRKDISVQSLGKIPEYAVGGSYNKKFIGDILSTAENIPFSPLWGNINSIIQKAKATQAEAVGSSDSNIAYMSDYEFAITPVKIEPLPLGGVSNTVEVCGYIIEKHELNEDGTTTFIKYFSIASLEKSELEDPEVVYGKTYKYKIKSVFLLSTVIAAPSNNGDQQYATYLFSSRGSPEIEVICREFVPPPPPNNIQFFLSQEKKLIIFWDMPFNKQEDIKRFQIFKRKSLQDPYSLAAQLDFDDSEILTKRSENVPGALNQKKISAVTSFLDINYDISESYYYSICSIDAHDLSSPYSNQFKISYNGVEGKIKTELIAYAGAPKPYPNFTIEETLLEDCMKDSGHSKIKIYFDPECLILNGPIQKQDGGSSLKSNIKRKQEDFIETSSDYQNGLAIPMYKLQIINLDRQQDQKIDIYLKRSLELDKKINDILPGD